MKRRAYTITGQSFTKPDNLPEGFTVEETYAEDPKSIRVGSGVRDRLYVQARGDDTVIEMQETGSYGKGLKGVYTRDEVRQVRDCLNAILGEHGGWRVFRSAEDELWFEVRPNRFTVNTVDGKWGMALGYADMVGFGRTLDDIEENYGPLTDVTAEHPVEF